MSIKSVDAAGYSRRIDHTHMNGGKPAFGVILQAIVRDGVRGECKDLRILRRSMFREARDHKWLEYALYLQARQVVMDTYRTQLKQLEPLPANVLECLCGN